ncbi:MAG: ABC transporter permease [Clostridia bacterium]|nr:ABC transporter permease [Clostridia bacterium]MBQ3870552.1 ABC transporter permease [Clostridia bacterium]
MMFITFLIKAVIQGTPLLFGATGEIITEKSGNLNLGIPGIMYIGAISSVIGGFLYKENAAVLVPALSILIPFISCLIGSLLASLIYGFLTITLRANQNVTGLALTTFGIGFGNFFGGSLIKLTGSTTPYLALSKLSSAYCSFLPFGTSGFLVYLAAVIAIIASFVIKRTRVGLQLRAVGENPATADAAGINVTRYKYFATCIGGMIAGLGGLFYIMDYSGGIWQNDGFGDRGWLAIAIVIFALWKPIVAIFGSYIFGGLYILYNYVNVNMQMQPLMKMLPYVVTVVVLIAVSVRRKREYQPPASLGLSYFREDR